MITESYKDLYLFLKKKIKDTKSDRIKNLQDFFSGMEEEFQRAGFRQNVSGAVENILIVRLDAIGDFILTTGFIREVRKNFPKARITLIVSPLVYPVAELCPYVNEVFQFDGKTFGKNLIDVLERIVNFCCDNLWQKNFSYAFNPQCGSDNLGGMFLSYLSGANERIGYGTYPWEIWKGITDSVKGNIEIDNFLLTKNVISPREFISEVEKYFYILLATDFKVDDLSLELWYSAEDFLKTHELLKNFSGKKKVIIGLGAGEDNRKYPVEKYLVALKEIAKKNISFILVGGSAEIEGGMFLEKNLPHKSVLNLVGKTTLRETAAVISQADFYIGNDSGVMHMAAAANVPVLAIYREAQDKEQIAENGFYSEFLRFPPWQTSSVLLRPDHALDDCANVEVYGGCCHKEAHCIIQIEPQEIIEGFAVLEKIIENQNDVI